MTQLNNDLKARLDKIFFQELSIKQNGSKEGMSYNISLNMSRLYKAIDESTFDLIMNLTVSNTKESPSPFDLKATVIGRFSFQKTKAIDMKEIEEFLTSRGTNIVYPYLRSAVTTLSTTALINPLVLPLVDSFSMPLQKID